MPDNDAIRKSGEDWGRALYSENPDLIGRNLLLRVAKEAVYIRNRYPDVNLDIWQKAAVDSYVGTRYYYKAQNRGC